MLIYEQHKSCSSNKMKITQNFKNWGVTCCPICSLTEKYTFNNEIISIKLDFPFTLEECERQWEVDKIKFLR